MSTQQRQASGIYIGTVHPHRHRALWGNKTTMNVSLRRCLSVICLQWSATWHCKEILCISSISLPQKTGGQLCLLFVKRKGEEVRLQRTWWLQNCISGLNMNKLNYFTLGRSMNIALWFDSIQVARILLQNNSWCIFIFILISSFHNQTGLILKDKI